MINGCYTVNKNLHGFEFKKKNLLRKIDIFFLCLYKHTYLSNVINEQAINKNC